ncbi:MAG: hypothetical protein R2825_09305 [Saprospiraceae bacterium]
MPDKKSPLLPIYITVFLDMLGIGIIIPVIPALFFQGVGFLCTDVTTRIPIGHVWVVDRFLSLCSFWAPLWGHYRIVMVESLC